VTSPEAGDGEGARDGRSLVRALPGWSLFAGYTRSRFRADLVIALSLWAVAVPSGLAHGQLAGLPPVVGLYTILGALLLYALFGSSRYLNVGTESSVAIVVGASIAPLAAGDPQRAMQLSAMLAIMVGGLLLLGGVLRLGAVSRLLSTPILAAYLAGSAVIIVASQLPNIFGIRVEGHAWWARVGGVAMNLDETNLWSLGIAVGTGLVVVILQRVAPRFPAFLVALAGATVLVAAAGLAESHGVRVVGLVPAGVPRPSWPATGIRDFFDLIGPAVSVALLVFASSMATGSALAARDREDLAPGREFVGLGVAGLGAGLLGGFPANASDSRSFMAANLGAGSQAVNVFGAAAILVTLVALTPLFRNLPVAGLGAVIVVSSVRLVDHRQFRRLWEARRSDFILALVTFLGVLLLGVLPGIGVGVAVSLLETMRRAVLPHTAVLGQVAGTFTYRDITHYEDAETLPGLVVYRFDAPLFFANAEVFRKEIRKLVTEAKHPVRQVVVSAEGITDMDVTGAEILGRLLDDLDVLGVEFRMARVRTKMRRTLRSLGLEERIGPSNFFMTVSDAASAFSGGQGDPPGEAPR
jgi:SulP family sulfate permease